MARRLKGPYFRAFFEASVARVPRRFAVVTAFNPNGRHAPEAANRTQDAALRRRLLAKGFAPFRVTGGSEDGAHREPGWGFVSPSPEAALELACEFQQDAYFWISGGRIYLGSAAGGPLKRAGSWNARLARMRRKGA